MAKIHSIALIAFAFLLTGCAGSSFNPINPPAVSAQAAPPVGCDANGSCFDHTVHTWGYCQDATIQSSRTVTASLEIGISSTPTDANDSLCGLMLADGGGDLTGMTGTVAYKSWNATKAASMIVGLRACTTKTCDYPSGQEQLYTSKFGVNPGENIVIPFTATFPEPIHVDHFLLVFNDDLDAKPTTISFAFAGTFK